MDIPHIGAPLGPVRCGLSFPIGCSGDAGTESIGSLGWKALDATWRRGMGPLRIESTPLGGLHNLTERGNLPA